ncbi:hypothetical protein [Streptomyces sp. MT206]|uniref:hypothetical protein n=1 Tax=Streptomyces sp. MT206 TaxID=3031407 RepID=UPI002FCB0697
MTTASHVLSPAGQSGGSPRGRSHLLRSTSNTAEAHTRLRRTAVLALDLDGVTSSPLWRTACLAVVVCELCDQGPA